MINVFKREMRGGVKSLLIWTAAMLALSMVGFGEYGVVMGENANIDLNGMIDMMPRVVQLMMGMGKTSPETGLTISINTAAGWFVCMYVWCALIICIHAVLLGASMLSKEERDKTSEFLFTRPIRRGAAITGKLLSAALQSITVVLACWIGILTAFLPQVKDGTVNGAQIASSMLGACLTALTFMCIGFFLSVVITGRNKAVMGGVIAVMGFYFAGVAVDALRGSERITQLGWLNALSPFLWFDASWVMDFGVQPVYAATAALVSAAAAAITYAGFRKRDIHC